MPDATLADLLAAKRAYFADLVGELGGLGEDLAGLSAATGDKRTRRAARDGASAAKGAALRVRALLRHLERLADLEGKE